jgi:hypothetical protein
MNRANKVRSCGTAAKGFLSSQEPIGEIDKTETNEIN